MSTTHANDEPWIVVWWDEDGAMFTLTDDDNKIVSLPFEEIESAVDEKTDDPDVRSTGKRYALPASIARDTFGWDV